MITGASGKTGRELLRALVRRGAAVRVLVHKQEQAAGSSALGAAEALSGDLRDAALLRQAAQGVEKIYHICPNAQPDEIEIGEAVIGAAREAGIGQLVFHSVLHPQVEEMPHHWKKLRVEELLFKSGVPFTILQPAVYMQNVLAQWEGIISNGVYAVPYAADTRLGMVDLMDVAEAAAAVLTQPGHLGAIYELAGGEVLTQAEVAQEFAREIGRDVRVEVTPREAWEQRSRASGLPDYAVRTLLQMFEYYEKFGFWGNPTVLTALLGRAPTTFAEFVARTLGKK
ncbi:MAG TPA: NmrA family NAD(P)-binding protein [Anaerolineaceae bacterium]